MYLIQKPGNEILKYEFSDLRIHNRTKNVDFNIELKKLKHMKTLKNIIAICIVSAIALSSCKKESSEKISLPPKESMNLSFDKFKTASAKSGLTDSTMATFETAKGVVDLWTLATFFTLAVPTSAFYRSFSETPEEIADYTWQWSYSVDYIGSTFNARLVGTTDESFNDVKWEMYISKDGIGGYDEFLWFEGTSKTDNTGGTWTLYNSYEHQVPMLTLEWTATGTDETVSSVKYTYVREFKDSGATDPFNGSYLTYGYQSGQYDAYFDVHYYVGFFTNKFVDVNIEWNTDTYNGRIQSDYHFDSTDWQYWDSNGYNTVE